MTHLSPVEADPSRLSHSSLKDYAIRFVFGGTITALVGVMAKVWNPEIAGLFLAFPAILVASLTLIGAKDGKKASGSDALGAATGAIGLLAFAGVVWTFAGRAPAALVLAGASIIWLVVSLLAWATFDLYRRRGRDTTQATHSHASH